MSRTVVPEHGNASKWLSHGVDIEVSEENKSGVDTETSEEARRLYVAGTKTMLYGSVFGLR